jgi:hypothetical protein
VKRRATTAVGLVAILIAAWVLIGERHHSKKIAMVPVPWRVAP